MRARFDRFTFDSTTRDLLRGDEPLHLSTKAFDLLQQLLEAAPRVLTKRQILDQIWPGTYVSDGTLAAVVAELRAALADNARQPQFIRTVHRVGYSFCGEVEVSQTVKRDRACRLLWGGREIHLAAGSNILGRDRTAVAWIDDPSISRRHAVIRVSDSYVTIEDLGSKNGTFVSGCRIRGCQALSDGDAVTLGRVPMTFRIFRDGFPTESVKST